MCEYLSFAVRVKDKKVIPASTPKSHGDVAKLNGLKQDEYREAEWTQLETTSLVVRVLDSEEQEDYIKAVLKQYPTRAELESYLLKEFAGRKNWKTDGSLYLSGYTGLTELPKDLKVGDSLYLIDCNIKEVPEHLKDKAIR